MKSNITEDDLIDYLKTILNIEGEISLSDFISRVPTAFDLSDYDLSESPSRPGEVMYEQRCRNIVSHRNFPRNMISYDNQVFRAR